MPSRRVSSFGTIYSELISSLDQLAQAHADELHQVIAATASDIDEAANVISYRSTLAGPPVARAASSVRASEAIFGPYARASKPRVEFRSEDEGRQSFDEQELADKFDEEEESKVRPRNASSLYSLATVGSRYTSPKGPESDQAQSSSPESFRSSRPGPESSRSSRPASIYMKSSDEDVRMELPKPRHSVVHFAADTKTLSISSENDPSEREGTEDEANAPIPFDTDAAEELGLVFEHSSEIISTSPRSLRESRALSQVSSSVSTQQTLYDSVVTRSLQPGHQAPKQMQFQMRRPWSDHGDVRNIEVSHIAKLQAQKRKRQEKMTSLDAALSPWTARYPRPRRHGKYCAHYVMQHPDSKRRLFWTLLCIFVLMYDLIMVPVDSCLNMEDSAWSNTINICLLIFWTLDILLHFCTGVHLSTHIEMRPTEIAKNYAKSYLLFDVLVVIPEWISFVGGSLIDEVGFLRSVRFGRLIRMLRVARILRILRMRPLLRRFIVRMHFSTLYLQITRGWIGLMILFIYGLHLLSCIWYALGDGLDDGWVHANELQTINPGHAYVISSHWSTSRLQGLMTDRVMQTPSELLIESMLIYISFICASFFCGTVTAFCISKANHKTTALWKYGIAYVDRHVISPEVDLRLVKFLEASHSGGIGETQAQEKVLLASVPLSLRQDLLYESRVAFVMVKPYFMDLDLLNERVVRQIAVSSMATQISVEREVLFAYGDGCQAVLFVTAGSFWYAYHTSPADALQEQTAVQDTDVKLGIYGVTKAGSIQFFDSAHSAGVAHHSSSGSLESASWDTFCAQVSAGNKLTSDAVISEAVLWTMWEHCGSLLAQEDSTALSLDAQRFSEVIMQHMGWCMLHTVKYAKHFVWHLNHLKRYHDLTEFPNLTIGNLDQPLFDGTYQDHFLFISHYKVEAGTEATLMRDSLDTFLSENASHPANNLHTPIFIDSEDLSDLGELVGHVKNSQALVLLLTPGVLSRPWVLIEIVTAVKFNVNIVPVEIQRPGSSYLYPDEEFYSGLLSGDLLSKSSLSVLETEGVGLNRVEQALRQVFLKIALPFSPHKTKTVREAELRDIWKRCENNKIQNEPTRRPTWTARASAFPRVSRMMRFSNQTQNTEAAPATSANTTG